MEDRKLWNDKQVLLQVLTSFRDPDLFDAGVLNDTWDWLNRALKEHG